MRVRADLDGWVKRWPKVFPNLMRKCPERYILDGCYFNAHLFFMSPQAADLKILLLQIREDALTQQEEFDEFVRFSGLQPEQFEVLNVFERSHFEPTCIEHYDALFVGGSSDASVTQPDKYPFVQNCLELIEYCWRKDVPTFASCFGFQLAVEGLGGKVILDRDNMELGVFSMQLTEAATRDRLFRDIPDGFWAVCGHKERAASLPESAILLASTPQCPYHAFRLANKPFYAFQFHPEVDTPDLVVRLTRYCDRYLDDSNLLAEMLRDMQDTPIANQLIRKFIERILQPAKAAALTPAEQAS